MPRPDAPPPKRPPWKHRLDIVVVGVTVVAGLLIASTGRERAAPAGHGFGTGRGLPGTPPSKQSARRGFEVVDMNAGAMAWVLVGLALWAAISAGAVIGMTAVFKRHTLAHPPLTAEQTARIAPPGPHLQAYPFVELRDQRAREVALLNSYAWLDPGHTVARIPIARAMQLTVGKPLDAAP